MEKKESVTIINAITVSTDSKPGVGVEIGDEVAVAVGVGAGVGCAARYSLARFESLTRS